MYGHPSEHQPLAPQQPQGYNPNGGAGGGGKAFDYQAEEGTPIYDDDTCQKYPELKSRFLNGGCRDPIFAVAIIAMFACVIGLGASNAASGKLDFVTDNTTTKTKTTTTVAPSSSRHHRSSSNSSSSSSGTLDTAVMFHSLGSGVGLAAVFCVFFMLVMKMWPLQFILFSNILIALLFFAGSIFCFYVGAIFVGVIYLIFAAIICLWLWCVYRSGLMHISSLLLKWSVRVAFNYWGTVVTSVLSLAAAIGFFVAWSAFAAPTIRDLSRSREPTSETDLIEHGGPWGSYGAFFGLFVLFFWGLMFFSYFNVVVSAGSAATFFFSGSLELPGVTGAAVKRACTTSLGSISMAALIVGTLRAIELMVRLAARRRGGIAYCIALCCIRCIRRLVEYFSRWSLIFCSIYGTSFITGSKETFKFMFKGWGIFSMINNDILVERCFLIASLFAGALCGVLNYAIFHSSSSTATTVACVIIGVLSGLVVCNVVYSPLNTGVDTLLLCVGLEENVFRQMHSQDYAELTEALAEVRKGGCGTSNDDTDDGDV